MIFKAFPVEVDGFGHIIVAGHACGITREHVTVFVLDNMGTVYPSMATLRVHPPILSWHSHRRMLRWCLSHVQRQHIWLIAGELTDGS